MSGKEAETPRAVRAAESGPARGQGGRERGCPSAFRHRKVAQGGTGVCEGTARRGKGPEIRGGFVPRGTWRRAAARPRARAPSPAPVRWPHGGMLVGPGGASAELGRLAEVCTLCSAKRLADLRSARRTRLLGSLLSG